MTAAAPAPGQKEKKLIQRQAAAAIVFYIY